MFIKFSNKEIINKRGNMEIKKENDLEEEEFDDEEELSND
jgi:hypothetical protein